MSVESLERAHREESKTPPGNQRNITGQSNLNEMPPIPSKATTATDLESDLKSKLNITKSGNQRQKSNMDQSDGVLKDENNFNQSFAGTTKTPNKRNQKVLN